MRLYPGSSPYDWGIALNTAPAGRAGHYAYENGPATGGLPHLTRDPAGQVVHIANNRDTNPSLYSRTLADGLYNAPSGIVGVPPFNGFVPLWTGSTLRLMGMVSQFVDPATPNKQAISLDWGQTQVSSITYLTNVAITGKAIKADNTFLIPVHYALAGRMVCGVLRSTDGISWTLVGPILLAGADLVEPTIQSVDGKVMMVMRREAQGGSSVVGPFFQTWLWPDGQQVADAKVLPIPPDGEHIAGPSRVGGSPCCLGVATDGTPLMIFAEGKYWQFWYWIANTWRYKSSVPAVEAVTNDAYRYIAFQDGWLVAGEPDLPNNAAQQCYVNTAELSVVELSSVRSCPITWPSAAQVTVDLDLTLVQQGVTSLPDPLFVLGTTTQSFVGWRFHDRGIFPWINGTSWPALLDMWPGIVKRLRMVVRPAAVDFWVNDRLIRTETYSMPTIPDRVIANIQNGSVWQISHQSIKGN